MSPAEEIHGDLQCLQMCHTTFKILTGLLVATISKYANSE